MMIIPYEVLKKVRVCFLGAVLTAVYIPVTNAQTCTFQAEPTAINSPETTAVVKAGCTPESKDPACHHFGVRTYSKAGCVTLIESGIPKVDIVIPTVSGGAVKDLWYQTVIKVENGIAFSEETFHDSEIGFAAKDLQWIVQKMTGAYLPVVENDDVANVGNNKIIFTTLDKLADKRVDLNGNLDFNKIDDALRIYPYPYTNNVPAVDGREAFYIYSNPATQQLWVIGYDTQGLKHGVMHILRELGYRRYSVSPAYEIIPENSGTLSVGFDTTDRPGYFKRGNFGLGKGDFGDNDPDPNSDPTLVYDPAKPGNYEYSGQRTGRRNYERWQRFLHIGESLGEYLGGHALGKWSTDNWDFFEANPDRLDGPRAWDPANIDGTYSTIPDFSMASVREEFYKEAKKQLLDQSAAGIGTGTIVANVNMRPDDGAPFTDSMDDINCPDWFLNLDESQNEADAAYHEFPDLDGDGDVDADDAKKETCDFKYVQGDGTPDYNKDGYLDNWKGTPSDYVFSVAQYMYDRLKRDPEVKHLNFVINTQAYVEYDMPPNFVLTGGIAVEISQAFCRTPGCTELDITYEWSKTQKNIFFGRRVHDLDLGQLPPIEEDSLPQYASLKHVDHGYFSGMRLYQSEQSYSMPNMHISNLMTSELLWNPLADTNKIFDEYLQRIYGNTPYDPLNPNKLDGAAPLMKEYWTMLSPEEDGYLDNNDLVLIVQKLDAAAKAVDPSNTSVQMRLNEQKAWWYYQYLRELYLSNKPANYEKFRDFMFKQSNMNVATLTAFTITSGLATDGYWYSDYYPQRYNSYKALGITTEPYKTLYPEPAGYKSYRKYWTETGSAIDGCQDPLVTTSTGEVTRVPCSFSHWTKPGYTQAEVDAWWNNEVLPSYKYIDILPLPEELPNPQDPSTPITFATTPTAEWDLVPIKEFQKYGATEETDQAIVSGISTGQFWLYSFHGDPIEALLFPIYGNWFEKNDHMFSAKIYDRFGNLVHEIVNQFASALPDAPTTSVKAGIAGKIYYDPLGNESAPYRVTITTSNLSYNIKVKPGHPLVFGYDDTVSAPQFVSTYIPSYVYVPKYIWDPINTGNREVDSYFRMDGAEGYIDFPSATKGLANMMPSGAIWEGHVLNEFDIEGDWLNGGYYSVTGFTEQQTGVFWKFRTARWKEINFSNIPNLTTIDADQAMLSRAVAQSDGLTIATEPDAPNLITVTQGAAHPTPIPTKYLGTYQEVLDPPLLNEHYYPSFSSCFKKEFAHIVSYFKVYQNISNVIDQTTTEDDQVYLVVSGGSRVFSQTGTDYVIANANCPEFGQDGYQIFLDANEIQPTDWLHAKIKATAADEYNDVEIWNTARYPEGWKLMQGPWLKESTETPVDVKISLLSCATQIDSDADGTLDCEDLCPNNANRTTPGPCGGCEDADVANDTVDTDADGVIDCQDRCANAPDIDGDYDGYLDCVEECPEDGNKIEKGICGCGVADEGDGLLDSDGDGAVNCVDECDANASLIVAGSCGCDGLGGDSDADGMADCQDGCPQDGFKNAPGICGCGISDVDSDSDNTVDCNDQCPQNAALIVPGVCGCITSNDTSDTDGDGTLNCLDQCPSDPLKTAVGVCGCGTSDTTDADGDGSLDCIDECDSDPLKTTAQLCGCGTAETGDQDDDGTPDCQDECPEVAGKTAIGTCVPVIASDPDFDLVPVEEFKSAVTAIQNPAYGIEQESAGQFWVYSYEGEPIKLKLHSFSFQATPEISFKIYDHGGTLLYTQPAKTVKPGIPVLIKYEVSAPGAYRIDVDVSAGAYTYNVSVPSNRPLAVGYTEEFYANSPQIPTGSTHYFYVPKATAEDGEIDMSIVVSQSSGGMGLHAAAKGLDSIKSTSASNWRAIPVVAPKPIVDGELFSGAVLKIDLTEPETGAIWKMGAGTYKQVQFYNIPNLISPDADMVMVPRSIVESDGLTIATEPKEPLRFSISCPVASPTCLDQKYQGTYEQVLMGEDLSASYYPRWSKFYKKALEGAKFEGFLYKRIDQCNETDQTVCGIYFVTSLSNQEMCGNAWSGMGCNVFGTQGYDILYDAKDPNATTWAHVKVEDRRNKPWETTRNRYLIPTGGYNSWETTQGPWSKQSKFTPITLDVKLEP